MTVRNTPHRPRTIDDADLGFRKAKPVHWLSPGMLINTAGRVVVSDVFGEFLDKRDLQKSLPDTVYRECGDDPDDGGGELWFDYVADLGDGFDATYSIAYLLAQDHLDVDGQPLPRGRFLVMGGDEIYPTPTWTRYGDKTRGPYAAAMPLPPVDGPQPNVYALPGNHDWYDGLTSFMRLFAKAGKHHIGGWKAIQARSYFAIELPHNWWIFAIDTQFGAYIDDAQLDYFHAAAKKLRPGDRVILCTPTPSWVESVDDSGAYDPIDFFLRTVLNPVKADVPLMLSGDLHHYTHYEPEDDGAAEGRQLIHCGGGGAYLYPTHRMPERIEVPPPSRTKERSEPMRGYRLKETFPSKTESRRYAGGVFWRVPTRNLGFVGLLGGVQTLFMLAMLGLFNGAGEVTRRWLELPVGLIGVALYVAAIAFAKSPTGGNKGAGRRFVLGSLHGLAQVGIGILGTWEWVRLPLMHQRWPLPILTTLVYFAVLGIVSTFLFSGYMLLASAFGVNTNELFSGQAIIDSKSFLRLHIDRHGALTVHPIKVPKVGRKWRATPDAVPHAPWLEPVRPLEYSLIEDPIVIRPVAVPGTPVVPSQKSRPTEAQPS
jgi:hypothetical protein